MKVLLAGIFASVVLGSYLAEVDGMMCYNASVMAAAVPESLPLNTPLLSNCTSCIVIKV